MIEDADRVMISMAVEWLTYAEFGERIGVTRDAARCRATRLRLRRQIGNDGKARVAVDLDEIELNPPKVPTRSSGGDPVMITPDDHPNGDWLPNMRELLAKAEAMAERERTERLQERERADQLAGEVADLARQLAKLVEEAGVRERDLQARRMEADQARTTLAVMQERMARAECDRDHVAAELAMHLALPWWRRLFA
jgi:outer membrane murein-binding lipoprotein Lpp